MIYKCSRAFSLNSIRILGLFFSLISLVAFAAQVPFLACFSAIISSVFFYYSVERDNPFQIIWFLSFSIFTATPALVFWLSEYHFSFFLFSLMLAFGYLAVFLSSRMKFPELMASSSYRKYLIFCFLLSLIFQTVASAYVFKGSIFISGLSCVLFIVLCRMFSRQVIIYCYSLYFLAFVLEYVFFWSGSGRLLLAANLLIPTIFCIHYLGFKVPLLSLSFAVSLVGLLSSANRYSVESLDSFTFAVLNDSMTSPIMLLNDIYCCEPAVSVNDEGIFDQYLLFLLGAFPRAFWPEKPFGFGFQYTVDQMDYHFVESKHSIAATFLGEHFYYLGPYIGLLTALLTIGLVSLAYRVFYNFDKHKLIFPVYLMYLLTFYWGGMASFSQRFQISLFFPFLFLSIFSFARKVDFKRVM